MGPPPSPPPSPPQSSPPSPPLPRPRLPAGLVLGLLVLGIGASALAVGWALLDPRELGQSRWSVRLELLTPVVAIAGLTLAIGGAVALERRLDVVARVGGRVLVGGLVVLLGVELVELYVHVLWLPRQGSDGVRRWIEEISPWLRRGMAAGGVASAAGVALAAWRAPRARPWGLAVIPVALVAFPSETVSGWLTSLVGPNPSRWTSVGVWIVLRLAFVAAALAALHAVVRERGRPDLSGWRPAARGWRTVAGGLSAQVVVAVVGTVALVAANDPESRGALKVAVVYVPVLQLAAGAAVVLGLVRALEHDDRAWPRWRLAAAAALATAPLVVLAIHAASFHVALGQYEYVSDLGRIMVRLDTLVLVAPLAGGAALVLVASAIGAVAGRIRGAVTPGEASRVAATVACCQVAAVAFQAMSVARATGRPGGEVIAVLLAVAIANLIARLALARLADRLAADLRAADGDAAPLPVASLRR